MVQFPQQYLLCYRRQVEYSTSTMDFLPVAGVDVPTTYQEWVDLDGANLASVGQVFTELDWPEVRICELV